MVKNKYNILKYSKPNYKVAMHWLFRSNGIAVYNLAQLGGGGQREGVNKK